MVALDGTLLASFINVLTALSQSAFKSGEWVQIHHLNVITAHNQYVNCSYAVGFVLIRIEISNNCTISFYITYNSLSFHDHLLVRYSASRVGLAAQVPKVPIGDVV